VQPETPAKASAGPSPFLVPAACENWIQLPLQLADVIYFWPWKQRNPTLRRMIGNRSAPYGIVDPGREQP
jgi:hypothetical protein